MIELRRDLYMDEATGSKGAAFAETLYLVWSLLAITAAQAREATAMAR
jgi:hypothetical protein